MSEIISLEAQAQQILTKAQARGTAESYMFITAFTRYQGLMEHLEKLSEVIEVEGVVSTNANDVCVNPAIAAFRCIV